MAQTPKPKTKKLTSNEDILTRNRQIRFVAQLLNVPVKRAEQPNRKRGKYLTMVNESDKPTRCILCTETRALERAHIIPVALYERMEIVGTLAPIYHHAMWMCPTHHKCYDKGLLNLDEKKHIKWILSHDYIEAYKLLLSGLEVVKPTPTARIKADIITKSAWVWWRNYVYQG